MKAAIYDTDRFFERYLQLRQNPISLNEIVEKPTMLALLPDLTGKKVLDLGCGGGEHLRLYLQQGAAFAVGVDVSQKMLAQAAENLQKCGQFGGRFSLHRLAMENLSQLDDGNFDVITSSFAFHYIENLPVLLVAIRQKLRPDGTLIFSQEHPVTTCHQSGSRWEKDAAKRQTAYRLNHYRDEGERRRNWFGKPFTTYHRTTATIINNLIQAGFELEKLDEPMLADQPQWHAEFKDLQHRPVLLFIKVKRKD